MICGLVMAGGADAHRFAPQAQAQAPLAWEAAPSPGADVVVAPNQPFVVKAVAADPTQAVTLAIIGPPDAHIATTPGNPATGSIRVASRNPRGERFALTLVARTRAPSPVSITRTIIVVVRPGVVSLTSDTPPEAHWAYVLEETPARSSPSHGAPVVSHLSTGTSDGQPNVVLALAESWSRQSGMWIRIRLTALPNGSTAWVPIAALSTLRTVTTQVVVDREKLSLTLFKKGKPIFRAPVGIGRAASPTPAGRFYVRERLTSFGDPFYGPLAFGTNARSEVLTDWPGGGIVGIHGTNAPALIPGRISHGCIRMRNSDIVALGRLLPLGTPILVR